jgi:hypothetical protein
MSDEDLIAPHDFVEGCDCRACAITERDMLRIALDSVKPAAVILQTKIDDLCIENGRLRDGVKRLILLYESDFDDVPIRPRWLLDLLNAGEQ